MAGYKIDTTPNRWAGAVVVLCLLAYFTRLLSQNLFVGAVLLLALGRGFMELEAAS